MTDSHYEEKKSFCWKSTNILYNNNNLKGPIYGMCSTLHYKQKWSKTTKEFDLIFDRKCSTNLPLSKLFFEMLWITVFNHTAVVIR